jgi:outer membrane protein assembly factor BamB
MPRGHRLAGPALVLCALGACSSSTHTSSGPSTTLRPAVSGLVTSTTRPSVPPNPGGAHWTTYYGDASRTGLATDAPSPAGLHKRWRSPALDGDVYAQPLLVGRGVVVATENDTVYALNAGDGSIVWKRHLGEPVSGSSLPCGNVDPVGITGTPVVDVANKRVYAVGLVRPMHHVLFALDSVTGWVVASVRVDPGGSDPAVQNQRSALTLSNGAVFVPFGGRYGDCGEYHGRVTKVVVSGRGLGRVTSYTLPTRRGGGWWSPPGAPVASDGSLLFASGNSSSGGTYDYGNSVVGLSPGLRLRDSWAPADWASLNAGDVDIGSSSPVLLPGNRVFQIGKAGVGYLLDAGRLGGIGGELHSGDVCRGGSVLGGVAHDGNVVYVPCTNGVVQVTVNGDTFSRGWSTPMSTPGPTVVGGGAVWTIETETGDLVALDESSGRTLVSKRVGRVPSRFTSPALGGGRVVAAAGRAVSSFGD